MKFSKIFLSMFLMLIAMFTSACSAEELEEQSKYGSIRVGVQEAATHFSRLSLVEGDEYNGYFTNDVSGSLAKGMHGFRFTLELIANDNVINIKEKVEIVFVVDLTVTYYDMSSYAQRREKTYENIAFKFVFEAEERPGVSGGVVATVGPTAGLPFGVARHTREVYYYDVSQVIKIVMTPRYVKSAKGKIYVKKPPKQDESSSLVVES